MANKIVGLNGQPVPESGVVNNRVVELLSDLLNRAESGQIHCVAAVIDTPNGVNWNFVGNGMGFDLIGGLEMVKSHVIAHLSE